MDNFIALSFDTDKKEATSVFVTGNTAAEARRKVSNCIMIKKISQKEFRRLNPAA